jgi:hypothetical protein
LETALWVLNGIEVLSKAPSTLTERYDSAYTTSLTLPPIDVSAICNTYDCTMILQRAYGAKFRKQSLNVVFDRLREQCVGLCLVSISSHYDPEPPKSMTVDIPLPRSSVQVINKLGLLFLVRLGVIKGYG